MLTQNPLAPRAHEEPAAHPDAPVLEHADLFEQGRGVDHHAVADGVARTREQYPGRHQMQGEAPAAAASAVKIARRPEHKRAAQPS